MQIFSYRQEEYCLHCTVPASRPWSLYCAHHPPSPVLHQIWNVANGVAVGQKIPAPCAVAVVVQPRAEDEVCGDAEEEAGRSISVPPVISEIEGKGQREMKVLEHSHDQEPRKETPSALWVYIWVVDRVLTRIFGSPV